MKANQNKNNSKFSLSSKVRKDYQRNDKKPPSFDLRHGFESQLQESYFNKSSERFSESKY